MAIMKDEVFRRGIFDTSFLETFNYETKDEGNKNNNEKSRTFILY